MPPFTLSFCGWKGLYGIFLLFISFSLVLPPAQATASGPLSAVVRAQQSVDACDSDQFNQAVDVPLVVNKASDALLPALRMLAEQGELGDSAIGLTFALAGMVQGTGQEGILRQLLVSEVRGFVATGINGGYFAGKPNNTVKPPRASLASTLDKMPPGRREIIPGKILSNKDGKALISAVFVDPKAGRLPLELAVEMQGDCWRIVEITNARSLVEETMRRKP